MAEDIQALKRAHRTSEIDLLAAVKVYIGSRGQPVPANRADIIRDAYAAVEKALDEYEREAAEAFARASEDPPF